jgi:hypothetical protein
MLAAPCLGLILRKHGNASHRGVLPRHSVCKARPGPSRASLRAPYREHFADALIPATAHALRRRGACPSHAAEFAMSAAERAHAGPSGLCNADGQLRRSSTFRERPFFSANNTSEILMTDFAAELKRCCNPKCRSKLPTPTDNPRKAFCTKGCYESFYLKRCVVCENEKPVGSTARRKLCRRPKCGSSYR